MLTNKPLEKLSQEEYEELKALGYLYEFYPNATGNYLADMWGNTEGNGLLDTVHTEPLQAPVGALEEQVDGSHYVNMKMQPVELTYALNASPCFCKLAKYLTREKGDKLTNLQKALHCIRLEEELVGRQGKGILYNLIRELKEVMFKQDDKEATALINEFTDNQQIRYALSSMYTGHYHLAMMDVEELIEANS